MYKLTFQRAPRHLLAALQWLKFTATGLLEQHCMACGHYFKPPFEPRPDGLGLWLCEPCALRLARPVPRCISCGIGLGSRTVQWGWRHCYACKDAPPMLSGVAVACDYEQPMASWVRHLKYGGASSFAKPMACWINRTMLASDISLPDVLCPVPISHRKMALRGYNQAALLARELGRLLGTPVCEHWLARSHSERNQAENSRAERLSQRINPFRCTQLLPKGLRIGIVDDVFTTGTTLGQCAESLLDAGAGECIGIVFCRTPL